MTSGDERFGTDLGAHLRAANPSRPAARAAILAAVALERDRPSAARRAWRWLAQPRTVRVSPLAVGVTLGLAAAVVWLRPAPSGAPGLRPATSVRPVTHFSLRAPDARRVTLVGDFNGWDAEATPLRRDGGLWHVDLPLTPGRHAYAFVVDGGEWVPDPSAPTEPGADFGAGNSLVLVPRS